LGTKFPRVMKNKGNYTEASLTATKEQVKMGEAAFQKENSGEASGKSASLGLYEELYVRRRYSFDNNGGGYQGL